MNGSRLSIDVLTPVERRPRRLRLTWVRSASGLASVFAELARRALDVVLAAAALLLLSPVLVLRAALAWRETGRILERKVRIGRFREPFRRLSFAGTAPGRSLPMFLNVLRGDLSLAGPRPLTEAEAAAIPPDGFERFGVRPGLVSAHTLRSRTGISYEGEVATDRDHYYGQTLRGDLGLVARFLPVRILGGRSGTPAPPILDFFGVSIVNGTMDEAVDWILERARERSTTPALLAFVNPDCLNVAWGNADYRRALQEASRVLPDGIGIHLGCRVLGTALKANVNGTDLFPRLCERLAGTNDSIYLLGARPDVAADAASAMQKRFSGLAVAGTRDGYFAPDEEDAVIETINASGASVLLVAFGAPKQELWLAANRHRLRVPVAVGVGGLFDFYSGRVARAPHWLRELGLEWSWRLLQEPRRMWRRYLIGNWLFLYRVWKQSRVTQRSGAVT
jgi:N-acetylglucosaminyldiphosphoundecaprenol N-acetyl-beta-D-mannosaminyltransferase